MGDDFVYANLTMSFDGTNPSGYSPAQSTINNNTAILARPSDYVGSIALLSIDNFNNPLIVPLAQIGQADPNLLVYQFAMGYSTNATDPYIFGNAVNVSYVPSIQSSPPAAPLVTQDLSNTYYYVYEYSKMLAMFNTALMDAYSSLYDALPADTIPAPQDMPTLAFYFDPVRSVITLKADKAAYGKTPNTSFSIPDYGKIQIYCNMYTTPLLNGLSQITLTSPQGTPNTTGCTNCILLYDQVVNVDSTDTYWIVAQQSSEELCYWQTATSFQVTTNMPIAREYSTSPLTTQGIGQLQNQTQALLADFLADNADFVAYHTSLIYSQTNPLKMFNLISDTPLYRVDAAVQWTDQYGRIFPLLLSAGITCTLKYLFVKKSVYTGIIATPKK
jgi:hypothetical protein